MASPPHGPNKQALGAYKSPNGQYYTREDQLAVGAANGELAVRGAAGDIVPPPEPEPGDSWKPVSLAAIVNGLRDGTLQRPQPTVGVRDDGAGLVYAGRVNGFAGASGSGKSMVAMFVAVQEISIGNHALYVDLEDDEIGTVGRMLDLGADPAHIIERFHYLHPDEPYGLEAHIHVTGLVDKHRPTFVVIDSTGESMALDGKDPNDDPETARWYKKLPAALAKRGPAVVTLDHVKKDDDGTGMWPIGSQRKRAAITGSLYMVSTIREFAKGKPGAAKLTCAKDRCGNYTRGSKVAEFTVEPDGQAMTAALTAPVAAADFRPTVLMERVSRYLELHPGATLRNIRDEVQGRGNAKDTALAILVKEGFVTREQHGQAYQHRTVKPYREVGS
jgi:hypothetical protein